MIYVNDLSNSVRNAHITIYVEQLKDSMQNTMDGVFNWYMYNQLTLSIDKCNVMVINNDIHKRVTDFQIKLGSKSLKQVSSMRYLGVIIDDKLKWNEHIAHITKRVNINNARLRRTKKTLSQSLRLKIHNAISVPIIDYASTVWGNFTQGINDEICRIEHMSARAISSNYDFINTRGASLMTDLNMTTFKTRFQYNLSLLMFKAIHGLVPDHIANMIIFTYEISNKQLRSFDNMNLYIQTKPECELFKNALLYSGPNQWNCLPLVIKEAQNVASFKKLYKSLINL